MKRIPPAALLVLLVAFYATALPAAQEPAPPATALPAAQQTAPPAPALPAAQQTAPPTSVTLSAEQMEAFLLNAKILGMRSAGSGITNTQRATLSDGVLTHDASIQTIDEIKQVFKPASGPPEFNFTDSYRFNVAGYRLAVLLDLDNVPMSVQRTVNGKRAAVTWWIDDVMMDDRVRIKKPVPSPDSVRTAGQIHVMRVFDELIQNRDRNLGNVIWTKDWKMWMIDHTRAFRTGEQLLNPKLLERIDRALFAKIKVLTHETISAAAGSSLTKYEIQALLTRRDAIVKLFEAKIAERGENSVLYVLRKQ